MAQIMHTIGTRLIFRRKENVKVLSSVDLRRVTKFGQGSKQAALLNAAAGLNTDYIDQQEFMSILIHVHKYEGH